MNKEMRTYPLSSDVPFYYGDPDVENAHIAHVPHTKTMRHHKKTPSLLPAFEALIVFMVLVMFFVAVKAALLDAEPNLRARVESMFE